MMYPMTLEVGDYTITVGQYHSASQPEALLVAELKSDSEYAIRRDINVRHCTRGNLLELTLNFQGYSDTVAWPKILLVPETETLFVGAGDMVGIYDLKTPKEVLQHRTEMLYWTIERGTSGVLLIAELELRAWDLHGKEMWNAYVEPPHSITLRGDDVFVDEACRLNWLENHRGVFDFRSGPSTERPSPSR